MRNELKKLTTKQLIELVKTFEHYPAVTLKDGKDYILSYLEDEACTISRKEIAEYLLKNGVEITQENIHLFYKFMSDEEFKNYSSLIWVVISNRFQFIKDELVLDDTIFRYDNDIILFDIVDNTKIGIYIFGIKDTFKPIDEYIKEIKESEAYKNAKPLCQIEIPDYIQLEDFKEVSRDELFKYLDKTIGKKKWRVQTERTNIHGYRLNSSDNNKIVGLMIVNPDDTKKEKTKYYIYNK